MFVDDWNTVQRGDECFIHIKMDSNVYDYLIEADKIKTTTNAQIISLKEALRRLKENYSKDGQTKEYVLVPRNRFIDIVQDAMADKKKLEDRFDAIVQSDEYENYVCDKTENKTVDGKKAAEAN